MKQEKRTDTDKPRKEFVDAPKIRGLDHTSRQEIDEEVLRHAGDLGGDLTDAFFATSPFSLSFDLGIEVAGSTKSHKPGQWVFIASLVTEGRVIKSLSSDRYEINIGGNKTVICEGKHLTSLAEPSDPKDRTTSAREPSLHASKNGKATAKMLDFHGLTTKSALDHLEQFFSSREIAHCHLLMLNHGKGTGAVKDAIHKALSEIYKSRVREFALDPNNHGITWVKMNGFK